MLKTLYHTNKPRAVQIRGVCCKKALLLSEALLYYSPSFSTLLKPSIQQSQDCWIDIDIKKNKTLVRAITNP